LSTDLYVLLAVGLLAFVLQMLPGLPRAMQPGGMQWGIGNRDQPAKLPAWAERVQRAHANLMENLPHYTIVVLVAHLTSHANGTTAIASLVFLGARIAHAITYGLGITYVRTIAFYAGLAAEIAIVSQLFG
jgi:uncharacterized MAPEG superfamily protein